MIPSRLASRFSGLVTSFKRVAGMPDYAAYVAHLRAMHPDAPVPNEREYFDAYLAAKYASGTGRCC